MIHRLELVHSQYLVAFTRAALSSGNKRRAQPTEERSHRQSFVRELRSRIRKGSAHQTFTFRVLFTSSRIPIIILTNQADASVRERAERGGCADVIVKPVRPERLAAGLRAVLNLDRRKELVPPDVPRVRTGLLQ